jgi:hypothetical protein
MKLTVQCTLEVEIEVPDEHYPDHDQLRWQIEENQCPGTMWMGAAIKKAIKHGDENGTCWACALQGENKIIKGLE